MAITGDTQLGPTKMEIISEIAQRALISESKLIPAVRDVSVFASKGNDQISFPKNTTLFTAENRASAAAATIQDVDFSKDTMLLDQRMIISWLIDSDDEIESRLDVQREYITRAAQEHARDVDAKLIAEAEVVGIPTLTAGALSRDVVLEMRRVLLRNKANANNLYLWVSPEDEADLLKIDPFVSQQEYGQAITPAGVLGSLYGVQVMMTPELAAGQYFMMESDGIALGFQRRPQFDEDNRPEYGPGARIQVLGQKFGIKGCQVDVPGAFLADGTTPLAGGLSALVVKDAN